MKGHVLTFGVLAAAAPCLLAASFDCRKAATSTEKLICSDAETSALDSKLQQAYKMAIAATEGASDKETLIKEQRNWIKYNRDICQNAACLQQTYTARITVLARNEKIIVDDSISDCKWPDGHTDCQTVLLYRDTSYRIGSFNQSLKREKLSGNIIGCSRLVDLPVGDARSNESFGGTCVLQDGAQRATVEICNADMTYKFKLQPVTSQTVSDKQLIDFTYTYCYGGE